ncbi:nucleotidyltransferase [Tangfeifania diversioriginum]|jgi:predicted nucleotidyltransferase|uniref:Nucleotidyltransferase n=1 Tax=Tangfeifania diversioriginum TaxID=1168035 RepID=A0A1M6FTQ0_9BACT|nr:nucleotidyltransferase domain-containing protein [Tangfeifania diversioriginum]SHJ01056.1 nucleotidyltransferase [Tangfeifania diversioriginum]
MDKTTAIEIAKRYIGLVKEKYQIESAILFGSFARGANHSDSDIDLAIVFKSVNDIIDLQIELLNLRTDDDLLIEPHPFTVRDFNEINPLVAEIKKNGIEIVAPAA